jgi:hypothetical protein
VGLGGAIAASRADIEGVLWNPAALASLGTGALYFHGANDFGTSSQVLGGLAQWKGFQAGLSYYHFDLGSLDARDAANRNIGSLELDNQVFIFSFAYSAGGWADLGFNYKLVRLSSACTGPCEAFDQRSTAHAFDLGAVLAPPGVPGLALGAVLRNLGPDVAFADAGRSDPLPARFRLGLSVDVFPLVDRGRERERQVGLLVLADLQQTVTEFDDLDGALGLELEYRQILYARAGYSWSGEGRSGPAIGLGLRYKRFMLDLGRAFDDFAGFDTDAPFQVSLGFKL